MWKSLRRRTMTPGRPVVHPGQAGLVVFTVAALAVGIYAAVRFLL